MEKQRHASGINCLSHPYPLLSLDPKHHALRLYVSIIKKMKLLWGTYILNFSCICLLFIVVYIK